MDELKVKNCEMIELPVMRDKRDGCLSVAENLRNIPFDIKRVYYIYNLDDRNAIRGVHAHRKLEQVLFCINGSCQMELDDGANRQNIVLDKPNVGVYIGIELWHIMKSFSKHCILLVLASDFFDESDYIRDYSQFLRDEK